MNQLKEKPTFWVILKKIAMKKEMWINNKIWFFILFWVENCYSSQLKDLKIIYQLNEEINKQWNFI